MRKVVAIFTVGVLFSQPVLAAPDSSKADRDRQIHEIIFKNYPPRALAAKEQGSVFFVVSLDSEAHPKTCQVTHGSGHPLLDAETCNLIVEHAVFNVARDADGRVINQTTEGVVNWTIPGLAPAPIKPIPLSGNNQPEKQICKKQLKPGYLSVYDRTCMTASEWQRQRNDLKAMYEQMQGKKESPSTAACTNPNGC